MNSFALVAGMLMAFVTTVCVLSILAQFSPKWRLLDKPRGHRHHAMATPMVGGLGIFIGLCIGIVIASPDLGIYLPVLFALVLVLATGSLDDALDLPASCRFLSQSLAAIVMVGWANAQLVSLGSLISANETLLLNTWSWPLSIFAIIGLINAFNMCDGVDGQCGALSVVTLLSLIAISLLAGNVSWLPILCISLASICGFLTTNFQTPWRSRASVFLGDAGSTCLGLLLAYCLIKMSQGPEGLLSPATALWLVAVPLIDTIAVMGRRLVKKQSPFRADREHFHHLLSRCGLSQQHVTLTIVILSGTLATVGLILHMTGVAQHIQFITALGIFMGFVVICEILRMTHRISQARSVPQLAVAYENCAHGLIDSVVDTKVETKSAPQISGRHYGRSDHEKLDQILDNRQPGIRKHQARRGDAFG